MSSLTNTLVELIESWNAMGPWSLALLSAIAFVGAMAFIPRTPTFIAGGLVFGMIAAPIVLIAGTLGGGLAFLLARHALFTRVWAYVERRPRLWAVVRGLDVNGWRLLALFRFWSPVPASVQNYAFALSSMPFSMFFWVSLGFGIPQGVVYTYVGALGGQALREGAISTAAAIGASVALLWFAVLSTLIVRRIRRELAAVGEPVVD